MNKNLLGLALGLGAIGGGIIWLFFRIMTFGLSLFWDILPGQLNFAFYPIVFCIIGGLIIGLCQKFFGAYPEQLEKVIDEARETRRYHYRKGIALNALLPLMFGGSLGPEAGLAGVIAGYITWTGDRFKKAGGPDLTAKTKNTLYAVSVLFALVVCALLNEWLGGGMHIASFGEAVITSHELIWAVPLVLAGVLAGYLYHVSERLGATIVKPIKSVVVKAVIGGALLGTCGFFLPYTMFSGEMELGHIIGSWVMFPPMELLLIGGVKILAVNLCLITGWRGGHILPLIFAGICLGCGFAAITGTDAVFASAIITAVLCGAVLRRPLIAAPVLLLCFPFWSLVYIFPAAFIGSWLPLPEKGNNK